MKKLILFLGVVVMFSGMLYADNPDSMTISVTITGATKSVDISSTTWTLSVATGTTNNSGEIKVTNNSGGFTETYQVKSSSTNWEAGTALADVGANKRVLASVIKTYGVGSPTFADDDVVGLSYVTCSATQFSDDATNNGANVAAGGDRGMWLQLKTPTSVASTTENITLYVYVP